MQKLSRAPSNETTLLVNALIAKLKASDDLRYNLSWTYGGFIEDIPRRIGTNQALDAAVAALVTAHSHLGSHQGTFATCQSLVKYSHALKTLRACLDDPVTARKAETLCAVMILLICQVSDPHHTTNRFSHKVQSFIGTYAGRWTGHCEGAAQMLKARGYYDTRDDFERILLLSLRGPVVRQLYLLSGR